MTSILIRRRTSIALVSLLALAILGLPSAAGAAAGDLDPSFGTGGRVVTDFGGTDNAHAVLLQPNGKVVVGGATSAGSSSNDFALARYTTDGFLDPIFGGDGTVTTNFDGGDAVSGLAFRPGGGIIATGMSGAGLVVARYRWDGSLDLTFGKDGKSVPGIQGDFHDVGLQSDGKIVTGGCFGCLDGSDFAVARLHPNGSVDASFGEQGGWADADFAGGDDVAFAIAIQTDGRIIAAGWTASSLGSPPADFALARYDQSGNLDPTFGGDGKVTIDFGGTDHALAVAVQSDGKIVVAGQSRGASGHYDFALARLNADGTLDTQGLDRYMDAPFGVGGKVTTDFNGGEDAALSVAIEPSGKIVLAGLAAPAASAAWDFAVARYNVDGSLDSRFGTGGRVTTTMTAADDVAGGIVLQRDGRIVAAGTAGDSTSTADFALARYGVSGCCTVGGSPPGGRSGPGPLPSKQQRRLQDS